MASRTSVTCAVERHVGLVLGRRGDPGPDRVADHSHRGRRLAVRVRGADRDVLRAPRGRAQAGWASGGPCSRFGEVQGSYAGTSETRSGDAPSGRAYASFETVTTSCGRLLCGARLARVEIEPVVPRLGEMQVQRAVGGEQGGHVPLGPLVVADRARVAGRAGRGCRRGWPTSGRSPTSRSWCRAPPVRSSVLVIDRRRSFALVTRPVMPATWKRRKLSTSGSEPSVGAQPVLGAEVARRLALRRPGRRPPART